MRLLKAPIVNLSDYNTYRHAIDMLDISAQDSILDVGCGIGVIEAAIGSEAAQITGIDISEPTIKYLSRKNKLKNIHFMVVNIMQPVSADFKGKYDKVICIDVLEHVDKPIALISFIIDSLKPGGHAVITFPFNNPSHGTMVKENDVKGYFENAGYKYQVKYFARPESLILKAFYALRRLFPMKEADSFDNTLSYDLLVKHENNLLFKCFLSVIKLFFVVFSKFFDNNYKETGSSEADRCTVIITKIML